jgi:hypothetical protein
MDTAKDMIEFCKKHKISAFKCTDFEFAFFSFAFDEEMKPVEKEVTPETDLAQITDDDLFHSGI